MKRQMLDQETFAASSLDTENIRTLTESGLSQFSHHPVPYHDGKDSLRVSSASVLQASKSAKELKPHSLQTQGDDAKGRHFLSHSPLNREHKPLSSSPQAQTSLCPQVRSRAGFAKGRFRVSFSEGSPLDFSHGEKETGRKLDILDLGRDVSPTRRLNPSDPGRTNPQGVARDIRLASSSAAHRELLKRLADDRKAADDVFNYNSKLAKEAMATTRSSCRDFLGQYVDMDSGHDETSLKHSSDAKRNSHSLPLSSPTSAGFGDFQSKCRPLSDEILLEDSQPVSAPMSVARKGHESPTSRSLSPLRVELKHSKSPVHCFKEANMERQCSEQKRGHVGTEGPLGAERSSPVVVVLQQLLELVDRYWSGAGSLLLNKDFLGRLLA
ncbi:leucine-rich repeat-containing protein 36-like [Eublepharis macularius]|uniref:Leucine-rich repeat-containing protein 36-like n=1 Tax=Eublepharis macularius TaxID=481883 RepID=A0AA97LLE0_EUBMA|nr:leucine-rich repeat-containing protein 36-like [Eublepharis macularius]